MLGPTTNICSTKDMCSMANADLRMLQIATKLYLRNFPAGWLGRVRRIRMLILASGTFAEAEFGVVAHHLHAVDLQSARFAAGYDLAGGRIDATHIIISHVVSSNSKAHVPATE